MKKRLFTRVVSIILALSMMLVILPATPTTSVAAADAAATSGITAMMSKFGTYGTAISVGYQGVTAILNLAGVMKSKDQIINEKLDQIINTLNVMNQKLDAISGQLTNVEAKIDGVSDALANSSYSGAFTNLNNKYVTPYSATLTSDFKNSYVAFVNGVSDGSIDQDGGAVYNTVGSEKKQMEFQVSGADLQYRYKGETSWKALCKLTDCSGGGSYVYRVNKGYVEWCSSTADQALDKNWAKDDYGIVYYVNQKVNSGRNDAYMSVSVFDALKSYFKKGARIDKYNGATDKNSTKLVQSFDGNSLTLSNDTVALAGLLTNNSFMPQLYDTTLYDYIDSYYIYRTMKDGLSYDRTYAAREALRDLFNGMFLQGACISYLYIEYQKLANPGADYSAALSALDNAVNEVVAAVADDPFLDEIAAKTGSSNTRYALLRGAVTNETITSCTNTENAVIVLPKVYGNFKITKIGDNAFKGKTNITSVLLPDTVTYIGKDAFTGCTGITSLEIPASVTASGMHPFADCTTSNIKINGSKIPDYFFAYANFTTYTIPNTVTDIGKCAFFGTYSLETVNIPYYVLKIGDYAFANSKVSTVNIEGNPFMGRYAFGYSFVTSYDTEKRIYGNHGSRNAWFCTAGNLYAYNGPSEYKSTEYNYYDRDKPINSYAMDTKTDRHYRANITTNDKLSYTGIVPVNTVLNCPSDAMNVNYYKIANRFSPGYYYMSPEDYFYGEKIRDWDLNWFKDVPSKISPSVTISMILPPKAAYEDSLKPAVVSTSADATANDPELAKLFDGDIHTAFSNSSADNFTVYMDYSTPFKLRSYSLTSADDLITVKKILFVSINYNNNYNPVNWTVYGSNDKASWASISSVDNSDQRKLSDKNSGVAAFNVDSNSTAYQYYKIEFTASEQSGVFKMPEVMLFDTGVSGDDGFTFNGDGSAFTATLNDFAGSIFGDGKAGGYILIGVLAFVLGAGAGVGGVFLRKRAGKKRRKGDGAGDSTGEPSDEAVEVSADESPEETEQPPEALAPQSSETREEATVTK